jgi:CcmD family protein
MSDLMGIAVVTLMIWVGLFGYVYRLDRKLSRLED